ncbi:MAG: glycogen synthase [Clostridiales Family XIII bacterium]|jgi:starch synthase|nr:glycogen synthase [Clostridiales Family XIII bacterium]
MKRLRVLIVAAEAMPFVKTGGLADVVGALPRALARAGVEAAVMMPKHSRIKELHQSELETVAASGVRLGWREKYLGVQTMEWNGVRYYFIDNEEYFGGSVYKGGKAEDEQYLFFCEAVLAAVPLIPFKPDIIHCNDWHTGMIPMLLKIRDGLSVTRRSVFTIHNIKFQGMMGFEMIQDFLSVPKRYDTPEFLEAHGCANMMKAALVFADKITTVSPTYAKEIMHAYFGMGMEGILSARRNDVTGIVNGIDTETFNPETDPALARRYGPATMRGKTENKKALRETFGLDIRLYDPVICMVNRLTAQKGLDLVQYVLEELLREEVAFVLLGDGDQKYVDFFRYIAAGYPKKTGIFIGYDEEVAHRIYAGSDFLLMPSQFEPCGLSQMIAQRYGTLPIVRETGGLADTVAPYNRYTKTGDGFSFGAFNAHDMLHVIRLALSVYRDKPMLRQLKKNAMLKNNDFFQSAQQYKTLYESIV